MEKDTSTIGDSSTFSTLRLSTAVEPDPQDEYHPLTDAETAPRTRFNIRCKDGSVDLEQGCVETSDQSREAQ
jgi:hypothetical protein